MPSVCLCGFPYVQETGNRIAFFPHQFTFTKPLTGVIDNCEKCFDSVCLRNACSLNMNSITPKPYLSDLHNASCFLWFRYQCIIYY